MIDFQNREISFFRNDVSLGVAFKSIKTGANMAYFPAISLSDGEQVSFNFGDLRPFRYRHPQSFVPSITSPTPPLPLCALSEPHCLVKDYHSIAQHLLEIFKNYIYVYNDNKKDNTNQ